MSPGETRGTNCEKRSRVGATARLFKRAISSSPAPRSRDGRSRPAGARLTRHLSSIGWLIVADRLLGRLGTARRFRHDDLVDAEHRHRRVDGQSQRGLLDGVTVADRRARAAAR